MQGDTVMVQHLNQVLYNTLTAINQTFLHSRMLNDWGLERLGSVEYRTSIRVMKEADALIDRILFLEGLPNLQDLGKLLVGEDVREVLECDRRLATRCREALVDAVAHAEASGDYASRELLEGLLRGAEEQLDALETEIDLHDRIGPERYQQTQAGFPPANEGAGD